MTTPSRLVARDDFVLPHMIRYRAETSPDRPLVDPVGAPPISAATFHAEVVRLANAMKRVSVQVDDCVAAMLEASPQAIEIWMAAAWLRAREVAINPEYRGAVLAHTLNDSRARLLITNEGCVDRIIAVAESLPHLELVVIVDSDSPAITSVRGAAVISLAEFVSDAGYGEFDGPRNSDAYAVNYTSGTTGPSKGVLRGWAGLHASLETVFPGDAALDYDDPAVYSPWAMFHSSGKMSALAAFQSGARLVQRRRFSLTEFWNDVTTHRCTHVMLFSVAAKLWHSRQPEWQDNPLRRAFVNPLFPQFAGFQEYFDVRLSTAWGMTEIGLPLSAPEPTHWQSCGRPVPGYEIRLVDEYDREVPPGEAGQLIVRHDRPWNIATEYLGRPEATAKAWQNGWFHTGDALRQAENGEFYFVDRIKDYIRHRGHNVSSREVEQEVLAHPDVHECACVGTRPDAGTTGDDQTVLGDEEILLFVTRRDGADLGTDALAAFLETRLPRHMVPRFIEFVNDMPRTPTMKIRKVELRTRGLSDRTWDRLEASAMSKSDPQHVTSDEGLARR
jgi:carnitine-CoA ligase